MRDVKSLDQIIQATIEAVEKGYEQINSIAHSSRQQKEELLTKLVNHKAEILEVQAEVERLEKEEQSAGLHLAEVSRNFFVYSEQEIQAAFEDAQHTQVQLQMMREREAQLWQQREQLEKMLGRAGETEEKADKLFSQVGMALNLLSGSLQGVTVKLEEMQLRQQLSLRIIKAQEEERSRVAREIHDGPAQTMANVVLRAEICEKLMDLQPDKVRQELKDLKEMVKESLQEVRKIIFNLRPMALDDLGVVPTLRRFISELQKRDNMSIELSVDGNEEQRLPPALEVAIFRIVQEALNNVYKHAGACHTIIRLSLKPHKVGIVIRDNGCGFDAGNILNRSGKDKFGLLGMKERAELLAGSLSVSTAPGRGTEIKVTIPLKE